MNVASLLQDSPSDRRPPKQDPLRWPQQNTQPPPQQQQQQQQPPPPQQQKASWPPPHGQQPPYGQPYREPPGYPRQPPPPGNPSGGSSGNTPYMPPRQQGPPQGGPYSEPSPMYAPMGALRQPGPPPPPRDHRERERERDVRERERERERERDVRDRDRDRDARELRERERERERERPRERERSRDRDLRDPREREFAPHSPHPSLAWQAPPPPLPPSAHPAQQQPPTGPRQEQGSGARTFQGQFHTSFVPVREASPPPPSLPPLPLPPSASGSSSRPGTGSGPGNPSNSSSSKHPSSSGSGKRDRERDARDREREAYNNSWGVPSAPPGMLDLEWEARERERERERDGIITANNPANNNTAAAPPQQPLPPPAPKEPPERVFRAKKTISLGTYVFPRTPFPYAFPSPTEAPPLSPKSDTASATATKSDGSATKDAATSVSTLNKDANSKDKDKAAPPAEAEADDPLLLSLDTRATLLFPATHLPPGKPAQGQVRVWGGGLPGAASGNAPLAGAGAASSPTRERERERERLGERDRHHLASPHLASPHLAHGSPRAHGMHGGLHLRDAPPPMSNLRDSTSHSHRRGDSLGHGHGHRRADSSSKGDAYNSANAKEPTYGPPHRRIYTDDSDPLGAAVHAGFVRWSALERARREGRDVRVEVRVVRVLGAGVPVDTAGAGTSSTTTANGSGKRGKTPGGSKDVNALPPAANKDAASKDPAKDKDAKDRDAAKEDAAAPRIEAVGRFVGGWGARCVRGWVDMLAREPGEKEKSSLLRERAREDRERKERERKEREEKEKEKMEREKQEKEKEKEKEGNEASGKEEEKEEGEIDVEEAEAPPTATATAPPEIKREDVRGLLSEFNDIMKVDEDRKKEKEKENEKERKERDREERERREREREEREERERDDPSDDGRSVLSAGWGAGHDGSAFEVLGVWVEGGVRVSRAFSSIQVDTDPPDAQKNAAHARTRPNRSQRLAEYAARRAELLCTADSLFAAKPKRSFTVVSLDYSSPSSVKKAKPKPSANPALSLPSSRTTSTTAVKSLARAEEDANANMEQRPRLRGCTSPLCPARTSAQLAGRKRRTRPWEVDRASPPTSRGAGANGSVLGVVWEVPEEEGVSGAKGDGMVNGKGKGGEECPEKEEQCACLAALVADQRVLKGRTVVCGFGFGLGLAPANGVGFKYDPDVLRGVLFPDPPAFVAAEREEDAMVVDGENPTPDAGASGDADVKVKGAEETDGEGTDTGGPPRKRRRVSGLEEVYAAALEGEGDAGAGVAVRETEAGDAEEGEKMAVEEDGAVTPAPAPAPVPPMEVEEKEEEKETEMPVETEEKTMPIPATEEKITLVKEKAKEPEAEKKPRDVHLVAKDGALLVFSPPSLPTSGSTAAEEAKWDVSRMAADGAREVLHCALGKDEVDFGEGGVRFRASSDLASEPKSAGEEGDATMPIDGGGEEGKSTAYGPWGERTGVVLWRYGS